MADDKEPKPPSPEPPVRAAGDGATAPPAAKPEAAKPAAPAPPKADPLKEPVPSRAVDLLKQTLPDALLEVTCHAGQALVRVPPARLVEVMRFLRDHADLRFDYIYEYWKTDDWSWLFANGTTFTYGTTTDGTQVTQNPKQTANYLGVRYTYSFR